MLIATGHMFVFGGVSKPLVCISQLLEKLKQREKEVSSQVHMATIDGIKVKVTLLHWEPDI